MIGVEQTIELRTARLKSLGHDGLCDAETFHLSRDLFSNHALDRGCRDIFQNAFFLKPAFES